MNLHCTTTTMVEGHTWDIIEPVGFTPCGAGLQCTPLQLCNVSET
jgi:hypothetical protein